MFVAPVVNAPANEIKRFVSGFPSHTDAVANLPIDDIILLRILADWVVETHDLGAAPVIRITCIGHADKDPQSGAVYEQKISEKRADAVKTFLKQEIYSLSFHFSPVIGIISVIPRIQFESKGVGSTDAKPAVNETQRLLNRRVSIVFERGPSPQRPASFDVINRSATVMPPILPPPPPEQPAWFKPIPPAIKMPKSKLEEIISWVRTSPLKYFDLGSLAQTAFNIVKDKIDPATTPEEKQKLEEDLLKDLTMFYVNFERERNLRTLDPPGKPD